MTARDRIPGGGRAPPEKPAGDRTAPHKRRLAFLLRPGAVLDVNPSSKEELLRSLAKVVVEGATPEIVERILRATQDREADVNTYVGEGVAIPHARVDFVEGISVALARIPAGFSYSAKTDEPVRIAVLVVANELLRDEHVHVLSDIASRLKDGELRDRILRATDASAVCRLFEAPPKEGKRRKSRPLSQLLVNYARKISKELGVTAIIISAESREDLAGLKRITGKEAFIVASSSRAVCEEAEKMVKRVLLLPQVPLRRDSRIHFAALMALTHGLIRRGDVTAFLSGDESDGLDTLTILEIGRGFGRFVTPSGEMSPGVLPAVLERILILATELGREGREGRPVGTIFVIGDPESLAPFAQQMVMNPFRGYPEEQRNILDPTLAETIKEFAGIDGAFLVRGDGVVLSAGTYLKVSAEVALPGGYGSRHRVAGAVTEAASCVAVVLSQSTGEVTMFKNGSLVLSLPRSTAR